MRGLIILCGILALCVFALGMLPASALPLSELSRVYPYLVRKARICLLTGIPTQANPIMDAELLAEMRRRLPDTFACGRCRYDLAGDLLLLITSRPAGNGARLSFVRGSGAERAGRECGQGPDLRIW